MNLYIRFFLLIFKRLFTRRAVDILGVCHTCFRVNPFDLDLNFHMNNGRYLSIMDLGRFDLMMRAGVFWSLMLKGYFPVVVSESIRFKRSLELLQKFDVVTSIDSWGEYDIFLSQKFVRRGTVVAEGLVKARFKQRGRKGTVPTTELFDLMARAGSQKPLSEKAQALSSLDSFLGMQDR